MSIGYIYVLSNPSMPGLLKIGYTSKEDVRERVQELSAATGVPKPFEIEYYCLTRKVEDIENQIHEQFSPKRIKGKEFFEIDLGEAVKAIDVLVNEEIGPDRFSKVSKVSLGPMHCGLCKHIWDDPGEGRWCPLCNSNSVVRLPPRR